LNYRQVAEWAAFERLEPFEPERADARSALQTYWIRSAWIENHTNQPSDYRLRFEDKEEQTEAAILMAEVADMFGLR
jgi:hypothetical protein